ncbi:NAD-dependent epimerase/dehydratase family protein [Streptomyces lancefieldiae]|uniref:NAD-dependent epimerase/dehydratase family protein n=1 Tax=Streptomyces lancefieldiae TaxID=3075520 RepID=A0ABU3AHR5_9ACTN|nr:NAD-dependent epimerase/dehydratase family protein [Streptomyces sp. DSM 40712]MDT0609320.1 NAD-dependent epimerase/dehydratase family protein [Streptomyces sp. DSM 40712]
MMPMAAFRPRAEVRPPWGRALVTGGAGFLGSPLCARLLDSGVEVDCLDNLSIGRAEKVAHLAGRHGFRFLEGDIRDPGRVDALTGPYDLVLHLAGPGSPAAWPDRPVANLDTGGLGTRTALAVAARDGARFLLASSPPLLPTGPPLDALPAEHAITAGPAGPHSARAEAVRFCEALVTAHVGAHGTNAGIVRLFAGYGPGMRTDDGGTPAAFIQQALAGRPVTVAGDGSRTYPLCYVDDMVDGVLLVAAGRSVRPVDLGGDEEPTAVEIARRVIDVSGSDSPLVFADGTDDRPVEPRPVTGFAREIFGWLPSVTWQDGLERTVASLRERPGPVQAAATGRAGEWWA